MKLVKFKSSESRGSFVEREREEALRFLSGALNSRACSKLHEMSWLALTHSL